MKPSTVRNLIVVLTALGVVAMLLAPPMRETVQFIPFVGQIKGKEVDSGLLYSRVLAVLASGGTAFWFARRQSSLS